MKKLLLFSLLLILFSFTGLTQVTLKSQYNLSVDTVTNTGTKYMTMTAAYPSKANEVIVVATVTEISGATGGTITVEGSVDGTNYYALGQGEIIGAVSSSNSATPTDVTTAQSFAFHLNGWPHKYVRLKYVGTGTMSAKLEGKVYFKY